jgi:hypothetical protein
MPNPADCYSDALMPQPTYAQPGRLPQRRLVQPETTARGLRETKSQGRVSYPSYN